MANVSVLLCAGCEIGSSVDLPALEKLAADHEGVGAVRTLPRLCSVQGNAAILESLEAGPSRLVLGGCSARFVPLGPREPNSRIERIALRELAIWSHVRPASQQAVCPDRQALAEDYLRLGIVKSLKTQAHEPRPLAAERTVLVVGGGPAGIAAALTAARLGYAVLLVEKEGGLGGWLRTSTRLMPTRPPYHELEESPLDDLLASVTAEPRISLRVGASIEHVSGEPGHFEVVVIEDGRPSRHVVGAIVQATGWRPYPAERLSHLGYGRSADVVTNVELERMLSTNSLCCGSDGRRPVRIAFIQCAGSRDESHLAHCSTVCCRTTLKQALWARELNPECEVYVLARDVRAPGLFEHFYAHVQEDPGILFTKGKVTGVEVSDAGGLSIGIAGGLLGADTVIEADLVVLATGMQPRASSNGTATLGLVYRQGPEVPLDRYGFPDSHFICFPYETRRTGIYVAGAARVPADIPSSQLDGEGAALKAVQAIEHAAQGEAMHPRWGDAAPPSFALERCTQCKRCTEECPFGTLDEDERSTPKLNPARCRRCGICLGACPERIIAFPDYSIDVVSSMIKSVPIPDEFAESPRILVLACENDAYPAIELAGLHRHPHSEAVRVIPVRCLGAVNVVWIADALARGYDGVLLLGCRPGPDTQCHFLRGSDLMATRSDNVKQKLKQMALEEERVRIEYVSLGDYVNVTRVIDDFARSIDQMGLSPLKDL